MKLFKTSNDISTESDLSEAMSPTYKPKHSEKGSELIPNKVTDQLYQQEPKEKKNQD
jgi:hypothetical protein